MKKAMQLPRPLWKRLTPFDITKYTWIYEPGVLVVCSQMQTTFAAWAQSCDALPRGGRPQRP